MLLVRRKIPLMHKLLYISIFLAFIIYPLYRIYVGALYLPLTYSMVVLGLSGLLVVAVLYGKAELIAIYYIVAAVVFRVNNVVQPSTSEFIIYSLVILHIDVIARQLVIGIGFRKTKASLKGILLTMTIPAIMLSIYLGTSLASTKLFVDLFNNVVHGNILSEVVLGAFVSTRIGSLLLLALVSFAVFYVITRIITSFISDVVFTTPGYSKAFVSKFSSEVFNMLNEGRTWHQKLFFRSIYILVLFFSWVFIAPIYRLIFAYFPVFIPATIAYFMAFITSIVLSIILYFYLKRALMYTLGLKIVLSKPSKPRIPRISLLNGSIILSIVILVLYIISILWYYDWNYFVLLKVFSSAFGFSEPLYDHRLVSFVDKYIDNGYIYIVNEFTTYLQNYINYVAEEYMWLTNLIKLVIEALWGG